jgi:uncharacterized membrane protein YhaH (DUF805 family)
MDFQTAIRTCLSKYVDFSGRARRSEYWFFALFTFLLGIVTGIIDRVLGTDFGNGNGLIGTVVSLALLLPGLAVGARRLHDTGRSGWWLLLAFIPILGWIALLVFFVLDSQPGDNQYGPNPKTGAAGGYPPPPPPNYGTGQYNG